MKILLCVPEYPPYHIGGGGEVYKNLAEYYHDQGNQVVVVYGFYPSHLLKKLRVMLRVVSNFIGCRRYPTLNVNPI
jgi:glycogen synthase